MKKLISSRVNESFKPKGLTIPDKCLINTFIFTYNEPFLEQLLKSEVISTVIVEDESESHWLLVTLNKSQYDALCLNKMGPIFRSLSW